jgi:hypothetical protein
LFSCFSAPLCSWCSVFGLDCVLSRLGVFGWKQCSFAFSRSAKFSPSFSAIFSPHERSQYTCRGGLYSHTNTHTHTHTRERAHSRPDKPCAKHFRKSDPLSMPGLPAEHTQTSLDFGSRISALTVALFPPRSSDSNRQLIFALQAPSFANMRGEQKAEIHGHT